MKNKNSKTIVLIHPPMSLDFLYGELGDAGSELPPQGLCTIAAVLKENKFNPVIIDSAVMGLNLIQTVNEALKYNPRYIGLTAYTVSLSGVSKIARKIKEKSNSTKIIVGGGHVSLMPKETMDKHHEFDFGIVGEGEKTIIELLDTLNAGKDISGVRGIVFRDKNKVVLTKRREFIEDLDKLPLPTWDLLPELKTYYSPAADSIKRFPSSGIVVSRGCPGKCFFCNRNMFGNKTRSHSSDYIIKMIRDLMENYGIKDIYIQDDTFTVSRDNVVSFCEKLIDLQLDLTWSCHARTDYVDRELLHLMKKAGCWQISFGIETGSQKILDNINKGTTVEKNAQVLQWCKELKLSVKGLFMMGNFGETKETIEKTLKFIRKEYMTEFHMTFFTPMPATVSWRIWPKYGTFNPEKQYPITSKPNFIPYGFTEEELIYYQKLCYRTFYLRPRTILYFISKMNNPKQIKKIICGGVAFLKYILSSKFNN